MLKWMQSLLVACLLSIGISSVALAQGTQAGLTPCGAAITLSASVVSSNAQLGACGGTVVIWNTGSNEAFLAYGSTSAAAATTGSYSVPAGTGVLWNLGTGRQYLAAITASSTTTIRITQGLGLAALGGGGVSSGGGTASSNIIQWASVTLGAPSAYGTSPGAVAVPGVNAFITNTPTVSVPTWAGGTLGAMANYGTSPGAVLVPGVNAFITNIPTVNQGTSPWVVGGTAANAAAVSGNPVMIGGWDGTNSYIVRTTSSAMSDSYTPPTSGLSQSQVYPMGYNGDGTFSRLSGLATSTNLAAPATEYVSTVQSSPFVAAPGTQTQVNIYATGTTAAVTATIPAVVGKTAYLCGFSIGAAATAGVAVDASITGLASGTINFLQGVGVSPAVVSTREQVSPCLPASATNIAIAVASGAAGTAGQTRVNVWGVYQ